VSNQGNTIGRLQGEVAISRAPAASANPAVVAETAGRAGNPQRQSVGERMEKGP